MSKTIIHCENGYVILDEGKSLEKVIADLESVDIVVVSIEVDGEITNWEDDSGERASA